MEKRVLLGGSTALCIRVIIAFSVRTPPLGNTLAIFPLVSDLPGAQNICWASPSQGLSIAAMSDGV